ncbi:Pogo transposable element with ZNF domain [Schistosoma japonicum]|uniref:Pogo transposable element with ZNF domain n=1 Tax=Schistosoma japonicum TaxID=6182 RepID=A0A4Z2CMY6_SCHJA|nr:Pogo transposable element with ZNF domain [Schistosoma japonicum]KAH8854254.1 Pogo transposable element with ZNF domain [Schistosoma japonicum]KAH8854255.1 Pogo transposable element with ZNF domain [Schistosoma japonicum]KAH8854256.1 Pogo transposable element with ZNF domain [Schistosoma japonicum]TNN05592.1 Pogo transposable element with ZNF domain [Schistosoma japonicum]
MTDLSNLLDIQLRIPWSTYYCTLKEIQSISYFIALDGYVYCPTCGSHLDNVQFLKHILSHLFVNELDLGSLMSFEFCTECLSVPNETTMGFHNRIHRHVEQHTPLALMDGCFVCPICENHFTSIVKFAIHLYERHVYLDSPYVCTICYGFRSSYYCELISHFRDNHHKTNHIFCPYCLKHFELPVLWSNYLGLHIFDAQRFYIHVQQHWEQTTYRCNSCRLDFIYKRDLKWHEYLHHSAHPLTKPIDENSPTDLSPSLPKNQLSLSYSSQLFAHAPRVTLKCLECGEHVRHPLHKHFNLTLDCASCKYTTSCTVAANWHWSKFHCAPPIQHSSDLNETKSWQRYISTVSYHETTFPSPLYASFYGPCSASTTYMKRCRNKHTPPGLFVRGYIECNCGFRTIVYDQMARHLATTDEGHKFAKFIKKPRLSLYSILSRPGRVLRTSLWWRKKLARTPHLLNSVGLY